VALYTGNDIPMGSEYIESNQNVGEIEQEISPPAVDKEQVEQAILLGLRKAFKGLVVALLGRACRVKVSRLRKDM
jgi:hypothetical protein